MFVLGNWKTYSTKSVHRKINVKFKTGWAIGLCDLILANDLLHRSMSRPLYFLFCLLLLSHVSFSRGVPARAQRPLIESARRRPNGIIGQLLESRAELGRVFASRGPARLRGDAIPLAGAD